MEFLLILTIITIGGTAYIINKNNNSKTIDEYAKYRTNGNDISKPITRKRHKYTRSRTNNNDINKPVSIKDLSHHFEITSTELNMILEDLNWIKKSGKWYLAENLGIQHGAIEKYNAKTKMKYIVWSNFIKYDNELISAIEKRKYQDIKPKKTSYKEKIKKGQDYEEHVANIFRSQGYTIAEHGKDNGVKDHGIDIIAKKDKDIYFIQCKNWSSKNKYRIRDKEIKITRQDAREYMEENPLYVAGGYKMKLLYVTSEDIFHPSAKHYIEKYKDIIEAHIITM